MTREKDPGTEPSFGRSRREFLEALRGVVGVAIGGDAADLGGLAEAAAKRGRGRGGLPSGYVWHTVLTARNGEPGIDGIEHIFECVMINDRSEVIFHARKTDGRRCVYRMRIGRGRKPGARRPRLVVEQGQVLPDGVEVGKIRADESDAAGTFVIPIGARSSLNALYMQRPADRSTASPRAAIRSPGPRAPTPATSATSTSTAATTYWRSRASPCPARSTRG